VDPDLRERAFGWFEGLTREECAARFPDDWASYRSDPRRCPPGGEPQELVTARMRAAVRRAALSRPGEGGALVVSHGGSMRALVASITGETPPPLANGAMFRIVVLADSGGFADVERIA
jgi:probable phosphoglycerate mutase